MATACTCCEILADVWLELVKVFCQHRQCHSTNLSDCGLRRLIVGAQSLDTPCTSATRCSFTFHPRIWSYSAWAQICMVVDFEGILIQKVVGACAQSTDRTPLRLQLRPPLQAPADWEWEYRRGKRQKVPAVINNNNNNNSDFKRFSVATVWCVVDYSYHLLTKHCQRYNRSKELSTLSTRFIQHL